MRLQPAPARRAGGFAVSEPAADLRREELLEALRRHVARLEQGLPDFGRAPARGEAWGLGPAEVDRNLAAGGLARHGLHDIAPAAYGEMPAAMGFALALALRRLADGRERRPLLWCRLAEAEREYGRLYGHGLEGLGLSRRRFVTVTLKKPVDLLWTMEEALKSGSLALVLGDVLPRAADLTATRRLGLAAAAGKAAGLLLFTGEAPSATASHTRWRVAAARSQPPPGEAGAPGSPAWRVELTRARGGRPGAWDLEWQNAPHRFDLVSRLPGGALHSRPPEGWQATPAAGPALRAG